MSRTLPGKQTAALRKALLKWFRGNARDLPWRRTRDPYRVWVSEIMLQQTRVEAVIPYYERFLADFPTVQALADAPLDAVLRHWAGLGYYTRARNLHRAAQCVTREHNGRFPATAASLQALLGIGRYTAAAIASIAHGEPCAALDGNIKRVLARLLAMDTTIDSPAATDSLWHAAERLLDRSNPGDFNQAIMELGATVCLPRRTRCGECPIRFACRAAALGRVTELPVRRRKAERPSVEAVAGAVERRGRFLLVKRPPRGLLGGLWELPGGPVDDYSDHAATLVERLERDFGVRVQVVAGLGEVLHVFTHRRLTLHVYRCRFLGGRVRLNGHADQAWVAPRDLPEYATATLDRKALALLDFPRAQPAR